MSERDSVHKEIEKLQEEIKEKNKKLASQDGRNKHHDEEVSTKGNQMRSPSCPKIQMLDLEGLRDVESKNILSKS